MGSGSSNASGGGGGGGASAQQGPGAPPQPVQPFDNPTQIANYTQPDDPSVNPGGQLVGPGVDVTKLTKYEQEAIEAYTGKWIKTAEGARFKGLNAEELNRYLYDRDGFIQRLKNKGKTPGEIADLLTRAEGFKTELNAHLAKVRSYSGEVYRVINDSSGALAGRYVPGKIVTLNEFVSTSRSLNASSFPFIRAKTGKTRFIIQSKSGKMVEKISEFTTEREVLFRSGTSFRVVSKTYNKSRQTWDIRLAEI